MNTHSRKCPAIVMLLSALLTLGMDLNCLSAPPTRTELAAFLSAVERSQGRMGRTNDSRRGWASLTDEGYVRFLSAPAGHNFPTEAGPADSPEAAARKFLAKHATLFGPTSPQDGLVHLKTKQRKGRHYVRYQQTVGGVPVFAAQVNIQLNADRQIESILSDVERDSIISDESRLPLTPALTADRAVARLRALFAGEGIKDGLNLTEAKLWVFAPSVVGASGSPRLVWEIMTTHASEMNANQRVLLDARTGEPVRRYPLVHSALNRRVHDSANSTADPGMLIRSEGQGASGIAQVDLAYEFLGDVYNFYRTQHGRDSIDGRGLRLNATVRFCQASTNCPMRGAFWSIDNRRMYFGDEFAVDDVIGHELTHGVTDFESNLVYENASGAINESFSDVWGEFVDLTNGRGNDADAVRWDVGEDLPRGRIRSISNPPATFQPARVGGEFYIQPVAEPTNENDYGGVHTNSGINNKLCYLLVDGDSFNGESIEGMGIGRVADLYYEVQTHLLTSGADWTDLFHALQQGAINLDWTVAEQNNLLRACRSVNVAGPGNNVYVDRGNTCPLPRGSESCTSLGVGGPFVQVADGAAAARPGDNLLIRAGNYPAPITLDKVMQVQAYDGTVFIGQ